MDDKILSDQWEFTVCAVLPMFCRAWSVAPVMSWLPTTSTKGGSAVYGTWTCPLPL